MNKEMEIDISSRCLTCGAERNNAPFQRAANKCNFCDQTKGLEWHHIIPRSLGGTDDDFNMLLVCNVHHAILHGMKKRGNIRELTKQGLERAKARGTKLGAPSYVIARASKKGGEAAAQSANEFAMSLLPIVEDMRRRGLSLGGMARELNSRNVETARGGIWATTSVKNLVTRLTDSGHLKSSSSSI